MAKKPKADALDVEMAEVAGDDLATFTMFGEEWTIIRKIPSLMLARLARIDDKDPEAIGTLDQVIEHALGKDAHKDFLSLYYAAAPADGDDSELLQEALAGILGATGRPTK